LQHFDELEEEEEEEEVTLSLFIRKLLYC